MALSPTFRPCLPCMRRHSVEPLWGPRGQSSPRPPLSGANRMFQPKVSSACYPSTRKTFSYHPSVFFRKRVETFSLPFSRITALFLSVYFRGVRRGREALRGLSLPLRIEFRTFLPEGKTSAFLLDRGRRACYPAKAEHTQESRAERRKAPGDFVSSEESGGGGGVGAAGNPTS